MKKIVLFLIFIKFINCLPENTVTITDDSNISNNNNTYSDGMPLTFQQNVERNNGGGNIDDPGMFSPMEDFDEEAIDAYCVGMFNIHFIKLFLIFISIFL